MSSSFENLKREEFIKDIIKNMKYDTILQKKYNAMQKFEKACNKKLNEVEISLFFYGYDYALQDITNEIKEGE